MPFYISLCIFKKMIWSSLIFRPVFNLMVYDFRNFVLSIQWLLQKKARIEWALQFSRPLAHFNWRSDPSRLKFCIGAWGLLSKYRVFIKYCVFFQEFSKNCHLSLASTRLLLVFKKIYQPKGVTVHSHCVESFEGLLQQWRRGRACSEL